MPIRRISLLALLVALGCGSDTRPANSSETSKCVDCEGDDGLTSEGTGGTRLLNSNDGETNPDGGTSLPPLAASSDAGLPGPPPADPQICGNSIQEGSEQCDAFDFGAWTCQSFGLSDGYLGCTETCEADLANCSGVEVCSDGKDNDGDGLIDCGDEEDCLAVCSDPCAEPRNLEDGVLTEGHLFQQALLDPSSCSDNPNGGGQVVFAYTPPIGGVAEVTLFLEESYLSLSVRSECSSALGLELECRTPEVSEPYATLETSVTAGTATYVVVESAERTAESAFQVVATAREQVCSDSYIDGPEQCDDGNTEDGDGCSATCLFEPTEVEPNATFLQANAYEEPGSVGIISSADDVDTVSIDVPAGATLVAETLDLGDWGCLRNALDSRITISNDNGALVAEDDDSGIGYCAAAFASGLPAGKYYVSLSASGASNNFQYRLRLRLR